MSTGENFKRDDVVPPPPILNTVPKELLAQLRRKQYPFKCKRHFEKNNSKSSNKEEEVISKEATDPEVVEAKTNAVEIVQDDEPAAATAVDLSPLPQMRKLIDFSNKIYVAPLTTVGNLPFRRIMKKYGADITCGEMALATSLLEGKPSEWALLKRHPDEDVFGVQLAAGYADVFTRTSELIEQHVTVDFVDLNLGCPLDLVCDKRAGAALMMRDKVLHESVLGITKNLSCPVTIKMRTGWDIDKPIAHSLVRKIQSWGLDSVGAVMVRFVVVSQYFKETMRCAHYHCSCSTTGSRTFTFTAVFQIGQLGLYQRAGQQPRS
jgi:tRNA-dihydrouridine synthase 3